jgi:hypothetical protein
MPAECFPNYAKSLVSPNMSQLQVLITVSCRIYEIQNININTHCTKLKQFPYMLIYKLYPYIIQHHSRHNFVTSNSVMCPDILL